MNSKCRWGRHHYERVGKPFERVKKETQFARLVARYGKLRCVHCGDEYMTQLWFGTFSYAVRDEDWIMKAAVAK